LASTRWPNILMQPFPLLFCALPLTFAVQYVVCAFILSPPVPSRVCLCAGGEVSPQRCASTCSRRLPSDGACGRPGWNAWNQRGQAGDVEDAHPGRDGGEANCVGSRTGWWWRRPPPTLALVCLLAACLVISLAIRAEDREAFNGHAAEALWTAFIQVQVVVQGQTHLFDVSAQTSGLELRRLCAKRSSIPAGALGGLYHQSRLLEDDAPLASYGVRAGSTIEVKARLRGGAPGPPATSRYASPNRAEEGHFLHTFPVDVLPTIIDPVTQVPILDSISISIRHANAGRPAQAQAQAQAQATLDEAEAAEREHERNRLALDISATERAALIRARLAARHSPEHKLPLAKDPAGTALPEDSGPPAEEHVAPPRAPPQPNIVLGANDGRMYSEELRIAHEIARARCRLRDAQLEDSGPLAEEHFAPRAPPQPNIGASAKDGRMYSEELRIAHDIARTRCRLRDAGL